MTLNQLETLTDDELALVLHVVNVVSPLELPKMTFEPRQLTWFKHDQLIKKLLDSFNHLKPEGHNTYTTLMQKLGVCIQIKQHEPPRTENTGSNPITQESGSVVAEQNGNGPDAAGPSA